MSTNDQARLQSHVDSIAKTLSDGFGDELNYDDEPISVYDYLSDALDIQYIVNSKGGYLAGRVLVAFGGPNIWVNTQTNTVEGYWWGDKAFSSFNDEIGLDDALSELWACR
jgi:hypothetical protein